MNDQQRNIRLLLEYEGTAYSGWQIQTDQTTIQGRVVNAIRRVTGEDVNLIGAGRTDAGVHALGQVANFKVSHDLEAVRFAEAINYYLPRDIRVKKSEQVDLEFHARFGATKRRYRYLVGSDKSSLYRNLRYYHGKPVDQELLKQAAEILLGEHDFAAFCVVASRKEDNCCTVHSASWRKIGPLLLFEITANRFLHSMVRSLVGSMLNLASAEPDHNPHNLTLAAFADIILSPKEHRVTFTAPAHGLYLVSVAY